MLDGISSVFEAVGTSPLTPITLALMSIGLIITSFARGWLVSAFQVEQLLTVQNLRIAEANSRIADANQRADEYKAASDKKDEVIDSLLKQLDAVTGIGDNTNKVLTELSRMAQQKGSP